MKRHLAKLIACLIIVSAYFPMAAMAATDYGRSIIYFDANDNIIGQQILYCNNVASHAGNIDPSDPDRIEQSYGCGQRTEACGPTGLDCAIGYSGEISIDYFRTATGRTSSNYCNDPHTVNGPFYGGQGCNKGQPSPISILGAYTSGWGG